MRSGIVHHKSDRKSCVLPTADRNSEYGKSAEERISDIVYQLEITDMPSLKNTIDMPTLVLKRKQGKHRNLLDLSKAKCFSFN